MLRAAVGDVGDGQEARIFAGVARFCGTVFFCGRLRNEPGAATTLLMVAINDRLTAAVEAYFADLARVRASGGATGERSSYGPLANLLNAVGAALRPKVFCVGELADQGAGHPDFGLYAAKQVQRGRPREGQIPERGVVEVKAADDDAWLTAEGDQVSRYWGRYRLVLVTNTRDFVLVGEDAAGRPARLESFRLADGAEDFRRKLEKPRAFARAGRRRSRRISCPRPVASGRAGGAEGPCMAAGLLCARRAGAGRGGGRCAGACDGAHRAGRRFGRSLRGCDKRRALLPFDAGADAVLRRFLRVGPVGAAIAAANGSIPLARSGLAFARRR